MNQKRYLQELSYYLRSLPRDVQSQIIDHYREQFIVAKEEGRSEADTILLLGRPKANAEKELAIYTDQTKSDHQAVSVVNQDQSERSIDLDQTEQINYGLLIILIIVNLMFVLGPAIGIFAAGMGIWASSVVLMATPLITFWYDGVIQFPEFYPILAAVGLGILLFVAMHYLTQLVARLIRAYFNAMNRMVRGR